MHTIKNILAHYTKWLWGVLAPLGPWGVLVLATVDGALLGLPLDALVAGYIYADKAHLFFYVIMASAGSALGSCVLYLVGYIGGETLLRRRMSPARYRKIHESFDKHEFWALMFPAMLPPPTPFKLFVLAAAVAEMRMTHFLGAIFAGRFARFLILGVLTIEFGPQVVRFTADLFREHLYWVIAAVLAALVIWLLLRAKRGEQKAITG